MIRVMKYKLYTLFHTASFYVIMIIMTLAGLLVSGDVASEDDVENLFNFAKYQFSEWGMFCIFLAIATAIYMTAEYHDGFVKSITANLSKTSQVLGNFFGAMMIYVVYAIYTVVITIVIGFFMVEDFYFGSPVGLIERLGLAFVVYMGMVAIELFFGVLTKKSTLPIVFGIMISVQFTNIISAAIQAIFDKDISNYQISHHIFTIGQDVSSDLIVGAVYIAIFTLLSLVVMKKKDI